MKDLLAIGITIAVPQLAMATGMYQCEPVPRDQWLSEASLTGLPEAEGRRIRRMKVDGGCREVYGTTPEGQRVEGYLHPAIGEMLLPKQRGRIVFRAGD